MSLAKLLSIVLVSSLGCCAGDAAQSGLYTGTKYLQWRHVDLTINGKRAKFEDLSAQITLEYTKGSKDVHKKDLVHCLSGIVHGTTIQEILKNASASSNKKIVWLYPNYPVLTAFSQQLGQHCEIKKAAKISQLNGAIKEMELTSNILS